MHLARGLGWFSIGLGLAEVLAPDSVARLVGVRGNKALLRILGCREIMSGLAILSRKRPTVGAWSRVGGDALDLGLLGTALASTDSNRGRLAAATAAVAGVTALDVLCSTKLSRKSTTSDGPIRVERTVGINLPPEELYNFWHNFESLPRFMNHLKSVQVTGSNRSHWVAKGPAGKSIEWDAEITDDKPGELIAWRSLPGADVDHAGTVRFNRAPGGRGSIVKVNMEYRPPGGLLGGKLAKLLGEAPEKQVAVDLMRFKQLMETGEIARTEGQPAGRASSTSKKYDDFIRS
jgi:uncharacterized membrane protein